MTPQEIEAIVEAAAERAAERAARKVLSNIGVHTDTHEEVRSWRETFSWAARQKKSQEALASNVRKAAIATLVAGLILALGYGFAHMLDSAIQGMHHATTLQQKP